MRGRAYVGRVFVVDVVMVAIAVVVARFLKGALVTATFAVSTDVVSQLAVTVPMWLIVLAAVGGYDHTRLGYGPEEFRRVLQAGMYLFVVVSVVVFSTEAMVGRAFIGGLIPVAIALTCGGRWLNRLYLRRLRRSGSAMQRVVAVGDVKSVTSLIEHLSAAKWTGLRVVGACVPDAGVSSIGCGPDAAPVLGDPHSILEVLRDEDADVLAVTNATVLEPDGLKGLAYGLEGSGIRLVVAPSVTDVAGPRINIRPVSGLPLLYVDEPHLSGTARLFKATFDRSVALVALVALVPVLLVVAAVVLVTSGRPIFFSQVRVGVAGRTFRLFKFRTMVRGADQMVADLAADNECDEVLFKIRDDPRITKTGRWLRRYSVDELPQLVNVVCGHMSLVGPRPPLPCEVEQYSDDAKRRLLVRPGLTGLGQVSGRSDLSWQELVRLDLHYVDNWSPTLDIVILLRTVRAVLRAEGAY